MRFNRPGPSKVLPNLAPGGVVIRVYSLAGQLLTESRLGPDADLYADAERAVNELPPDIEGTVLVVYDGDTGFRWGPADWFAATGKLPGAEA